MCFDSEDVATFIAVAGILSVVAQVNNECCQVNNYCWHKLVNTVPIERQSVLLS